MPGASATVDRCAAIKDAAVTIFAAHGFDAGTIRQIAREAGVAEGLIYHYFESKEALLLEVIRERSVLSWLRRPDALPESLPVGIALRRFASEALDRLNANSDIFAVVWSQVATNPKLAQTLGRAMRELTDRLAGYLDRKAARGEIRSVDTAAAARVLAGSLMGFTIQQHRLSPPLRLMSPDAFGDSMVDILVNGMQNGKGGVCDDEFE